jgi:ABC-type transport system substrate-binding protein
MSFEYVYSTPMPIIDGLMNSKRIPSPNFWRYSNSAVDAALAEFSQAADSDAANKIAAKIVGLAQDDPPSVYLYQTLTNVIQQRRVQNLTINGHSVPMLWRVTLAP